MDNAHPGPWGEGMPPWDKNSEAALKKAVSNYVKSLRATLKAEGRGGSGQAIADYIGGGVAQSAVHSWLTAKSLPGQPYIHALARIRGVSPGEMWDYFYAEAGLIPEEVLEQDETLLSMAEQFALMCKDASPDQLLEFQQVWLNECLKRQEKEL